MDPQRPSPSIAPYRTASYRPTEKEAYQRKAFRTVDRSWLLVVRGLW
eukprot:CAMPEP_0196729544 /NCGR_PEP_ID=MMETSP1091-20130531/9912_1 /TAXON_ID=302021 /ORGANISM="Rhodomonas sp., Strain CCMP768" /LENGTH=46 /DNA_ID= /DNA_START= /DNA_END= /DNA_ORIENTATION=